MRRLSARRIADFKARVRLWAMRLHDEPRRIEVRVMRRKWGSCSTAGRLYFAADLLGKNAEAQDYVIVHEFLHLRRARHGKLFRAYMSR